MREIGKCCSAPSHTLHLKYNHCHNHRADKHPSISHFSILFPLLLICLLLPKPDPTATYYLSNLFRACNWTSTSTLPSHSFCFTSGLLSCSNTVYTTHHNCGYCNHASLTHLILYTMHTSILCVASGHATTHYLLPQLAV